MQCWASRRWKHTSTDISTNRRARRWREPPPTTKTVQTYSPSGRAGLEARKSEQDRSGFRLAAPASTATSGESSQLVSSPLVCWTPIRQHVTSPLVFDKHYHSLALHDKSVIQPLHHHHQQKSVLDFPREFWTLMKNDNPSVYIVCTSGTVPPQLLSSANPGRCFEQCHDRRTTRNPYIFSPHEVYQFTSFDVP